MYKCVYIYIYICSYTKTIETLYEAPETLYKSPTDNAKPQKIIQKNPQYYTPIQNIRRNLQAIKQNF